MSFFPSWAKVSPKYFIRKDFTALYSDSPPAFCKEKNSFSRLWEATEHVSLSSIPPKRKPFHTDLFVLWCRPSRRSCIFLTQSSLLNSLKSHCISVFTSENTQWESGQGGDNQAGLCGRVAYFWSEALSLTPSTLCGGPFPQPAAQNEAGNGPPQLPAV